MRDTDFKALLLLMGPQLIKREMKLEGLDLISAAEKVYASQEFERIEQGKLQPFMELVSREEGLSIGKNGEVYLYALELYRQSKDLTGKKMGEIFSEKDAWRRLFEHPELMKLLSPGKVCSVVDKLL